MERLLMVGQLIDNSGKPSCFFKVWEQADKLVRVELISHIEDTRPVLESDIFSGMEAIGPWLDSRRDY